MDSLLRSLVLRGVFLKKSFANTWNTPNIGNIDGLMVRILSEDLREISDARTPDLFEPEMHGKVLKGPLLLQCEDWRDISRALPQDDGLVDVDDAMEDDGSVFGRRGGGGGKASEADVASVGSSNRMLKLLCTDGVQDILAFEYRWCRQLDPSRMKRGCKILVKECLILRGHLVLVPECVEFLGGNAPVAEVLLDDATMAEVLSKVEESRKTVIAPVVAPPPAPAPVEKRKKKKYLSDSSGD